jgi:hypothetical protein
MEQRINQFPFFVVRKIGLAKKNLVAEQDNRSKQKRLQKHFFTILQEGKLPGFRLKHLDRR